MPRYMRPIQGKLESKERGFESVAHMTQFLARVPEKHWKLFQDKAQDYRSGASLPRKKLQKDALGLITRHKARKLIHNVEWARHKGTKRGAGIPEAISVLSHVVSNTLGFKYLKDLIGYGPERKPLSVDEINLAKALQESYKKIEDRADRIDNMIRQPEYGSDRISVWQREDGEYLISVHGTKGTFHDIGQDILIAGGRERTTNQELEALMDRFDQLGFKYDLVGHSLATEYIYNALPEHGQNIDGIYLFSPASSPFQDVQALKDEANDPRIQFFINEGDFVSSALYGQMDQDTLDERVHIAPYAWSPLAAHGLEQWLSPEEEEEHVQDD